MNNQVDIKGHTITINGVKYKNKRGVVDAILTLLRLYNYTFDYVSRPCPCILTNYRDVDMKHLFRMFLRVYRFLDSDEAIKTFDRYKDFLVLSPHGFEFSDSEHKLHNLYSVMCTLPSHTYHNFILAENLPTVLYNLKRCGAKIITVS